MKWKNKNQLFSTVQNFLYILSQLILHLPYDVEISCTCDMISLSPLPCTQNSCSLTALTSTQVITPHHRLTNYLCISLSNPKQRESGGCKLMIGSAWAKFLDQVTLSSDLQMNLFDQIPTRGHSASLRGHWQWRAGRHESHANAMDILFKKPTSSEW